ncbi:MAG: hypothetical protein RIC87_15810 [Kiloniellales bacterium]
MTKTQVVHTLGPPEAMRWQDWPLPDGLDEGTVAALPMKGMTAHYLLHRTDKVQPGDSVLVHAAAGAIGPILRQSAKRWAPRC